MFENHAHARSVYKNKNKFNGLFISELWLKILRFFQTCDQIDIFHIRLHIDMVKFDNSSVLWIYCLELACADPGYFFRSITII